MKRNIRLASEFATVVSVLLTLFIFINVVMFYIIFFN